MPFQPPAAPTVTTGNDVVNFIQQVDSEIFALNDDVARQVNAPGLSQAAINSRWAWSAKWIEFRDYWLKGTYFMPNPWAVWNQTAQYEAQNEDWRTELARAGVRSSGPVPHVIPQNNTVGDIKDLALTLGGVALLAWLLWEFK